MALWYRRLQINRIWVELYCGCKCCEHLQLTVRLRFVNRAGKVICSKHPAVISIWLYFVLNCAPCYLFTIENLLLFVRRILCRLIWPQSIPRFSPPVLPASLCLSLMHLSPLLSINTPFSPLQKPDSHWFSDLYTHQHHPLSSSGSLLLLSMVLYCLHLFISPSLYRPLPLSSTSTTFPSTFSPPLARKRERLRIVHGGSLSQDTWKGFEWA